MNRGSNDSAKNIVTSMRTILFIPKSLIRGMADILIQLPPFYTALI